MVELCNAERLGWAVLTMLTAFVAATPSRLYSIFLHGKLRPGASTTSEVGFPLRWLNVEVPKRLFSHFYFFCLVSSALVFIDTIFYGGSLFVGGVQGKSVCSRVAGRSDQVLELGVESLLCLLLLNLHAARRLWECVMVSSWGSSRISLAGYAAGIVHYQLMVFTVLVEAPPLGLLAEEAWSRSSGGASDMVLALATSVKLRHAVAMGLFIIGFVRQHEAIRHLASLKRNVGTKATKYAIPTAGWFQYVSCPHYFAELLVYGSFVLLGSFKGRGLGQGYLVAFAWVFANQALVAGWVQAWYQQKFEDYPRDRRRLIPGVW
ncbi:unnamed protein product [Ectocarpus sp. 4 AP-2014]